VFEGFVDLLAEGEDGLVVVDYKTDRFAGTPDAALVSRHRLQIAAYAEALAAVTRQPVDRCVLVFAGAEPVAEVHLAGADLAEARAEALAVAGSVAGGGASA
jgi:ATP-dependent helicase/nuclease subunit A